MPSGLVFGSQASLPALVGRILGGIPARLLSHFPVVAQLFLMSTLVVAPAFWLTLARWIVVRLGRTASAHAGQKGESLT